MSDPILVQDVKPIMVKDVKPIAVKDNNDIDVPVIVKHQATNTIKEESVQVPVTIKTEDNKNIESPQEIASKAAVINPTQEFKDSIEKEAQNSTRSQDIEPDSNQEQQSAESVITDNVSDNSSVTEESHIPKVAEDQIKKPDDFEAVDNLPSDIAKLSTTISDKSQQPKIYDTKEYHVPIAVVSHKHGGSVGTVIAGALSAVVVVVVIYFVAR